MIFKKIFFLLNFLIISSLHADELASLAQSLQGVSASSKQARLVQLDTEIARLTEKLKEKEQKEARKNELKELTSKTAWLTYQHIKKFVDKQYNAGTYQKNYETTDVFTATEFLETADAFVAKMKEKLNAASWLVGGTQDYYFVRKLVVPADSVIQFRGDLHGDVRSLINWLEYLRDDDRSWFDKKNPFKLAKPGRYLAFLGDYTDRGKYGAEVMYIIMQLFLHNPDNVLIVRGNHEDFNVVSRYGFVAINDFQSGELYKKFGEKFEYAFENVDAIKNIMDVYDYLPVALFLGCENKKTDGVDFVQCCHGGMEPLYNSKPLLEDPKKDLYERLDKKLESERDQVPCALGFNIEKLLAQCDCNEAQCTNNGFMWNDFDFFNMKPHGTWEFRPGRGRVVHQKLATEILQHAGGKNKVYALFRAHQHDEQTVPHILKYGNGVYKLWSEKTTKAKDWGSTKDSGNVQWTGENGVQVPLEKYSVWTFNVAPRTGVYEKLDSEHFKYDTVARLVLKPGFDNWQLYPIKINVG